MKPDPAQLFGVVHLSDLDSGFIESIKQAGIDAHPAKVLAQRLPMCPAAADRAMMDANHAVTPDIGRGVA